MEEWKRKGFETVRAGKSALKQRSLTTYGQGWCHAGLQHAGAPYDHTSMRIEIGLVEGMRHFTDQAPGSSNRQARVGIERDDIADAGWQ